MTPDRRKVEAAYAIAERRAQGVPAHLSDGATLERIADLLMSAGCGPIATAAATKKKFRQSVTSLAEREVASISGRTSSTA